MYKLEQTFSHSVLPTLNEGKVCVDYSWVSGQQEQYDTLICKLQKRLPANRTYHPESLEQSILQYMSSIGLYATKDLAQLDALSSLHPVYRMVSELLKAQQFHKQWVNKLIPYYSKTSDRLELTGHWRSFTSYTGRITASKLPLTSMPNKMKQWIIPSESGCSIWSIDLNNAELRFLALYSNDQQLTDDLKNGRDIHHIVGTLFQQHLSYKSNEPDHRKAAKTFIFAMLYGAGDYRLAEGLKKSGYIIQSNDVIHIKKTVFSRYTSLEGYFKSVESSDLVNCFFGPIRPMVNMTCSQKRNFALQSSIATAIKILSLIATSMRLKVISIIHDEIWVEVPDTRNPIWMIQLEKTFSDSLKASHPLFPADGLLKIKKLGGTFL